MALYSIKDLEKISNQKAHTIRIWEQRYGLLKPERTETNIRFYDDEQLRKLLNVCTLMAKGMKISHISKLDEKQLAAEIDQVIEDSFRGDRDMKPILNEAVLAMATYDQLLFNQVFSNAVDRFGLVETYIEIIYPLLVRTGLMWVKDDLLPAQEHFLSNLIRQKIFSAIEGLPLPADSDQTWVLFLNQEEDHEIGLLFAYYIIRQQGKKVIYLGQRVPYENLADVVVKCKPTHIYSFFVRHQPLEELSDLITRLADDFPASKVCISGGNPVLTGLNGHNNSVVLIDSITGLKEIISNPYVNQK